MRYSEETFRSDNTIHVSRFRYSVIGCRTESESMFQLQAELKYFRWCGPVESMSDIPIMVMRFEKASNLKLGRVLKNVAASGWLANPNCQGQDIESAYS